MNKENESKDEVKITISQLNVLRLAAMQPNKYTDNKELQKAIEILTEAVACDSMKIKIVKR